MTTTWHTTLILVVFDAFVLHTAAHSHSRRDLLQKHNSNPTRVNEPLGPGNGNIGGRMFNFSGVGGAASFLANMDQARLQRIIERASWKRSLAELVLQLETDPDFVSLMTASVLAVSKR
jgi:hypothetical protein